MKAHDPFGARTRFETGDGPATAYRIDRIERQGITDLDRLPFSIRILLESALRNCDDFQVREQDVVALASWTAKASERPEVPFKPARVVLQDFTGVPAVVDLAALRSAMKRLGGNPRRINPTIPVDLVIDHSVQVDVAGDPEALAANARFEFERNRERYEFLRWGQRAFERFRCVPPATGIVHQVNLEYLADVVQCQKRGKEAVAYPDSLVGTDSHTTMINGLGVLGWGVGGIEAEAAMLGQPLYMVAPEVVGFRMVGELPEGATATDLVLTVTQILRKKGVVEKFVEFFGPGTERLSLADRATLANMAPEYGATMGFFPVDGETIEYLRRTGRSEKLCQLVDRYCKENRLFREPGSKAPDYSDTLELDLSKIEPSLAGPKRPQDRVPLSAAKASIHKAVEEFGKKLDGSAPRPTVRIKRHDGDREGRLTHGSVVIAAITSCTNTSNPSVMLAAGLVAKKARARGLKVSPHVKTSLAPGSRVVTRYLEGAGLLKPLEELGFHVVGYGCTTCIGNSGPLDAGVSEAIRANDLVVAAVLSGNRNFEGRVHPQTRANYLASPPLVVAYAIAGTMDLDPTKDPLGEDEKGKPVFLKDVWPTSAEVQAAVAKAFSPEIFAKEYADVFAGSSEWNRIKVREGDLYTWDAKSTYIQEPPFFVGLAKEPPAVKSIEGARCLALLGDSVTTDHISPAGDIPKDGPAARYLQENGVPREEFNSFGARRGNHEVMMRGTFGNIRLKNRLVPGSEGNVTLHLGAGSGGQGEKMSIYDAAMRYRDQGIPLVILAGKEYGTGSSRDWAAKGTILLGVRAVIAQSFERIHRSNLVGMGVLPLQFQAGQSAESLGLTGHETFRIEGLAGVQPGCTLAVVAQGGSGEEKRFEVQCRIDTPVEVKYFRNGGILHSVLRDMIKE